MHTFELESLEQLERHAAAEGTLCGAVFQGLDLRGHTALLLAAPLADTVFLGCRLEPAALAHAQAAGALIFPRLPAVPYDAYRANLYTGAELFGGYQPGEHETYAATVDGRIHAHYVATGKDQPQSILETLARRLHDHAITDALEELTAGRQVVAIMGGHAMGRDQPAYRQVARIARALTRRGFLLASGGGPGAMEATHLGAWLAAHPDDALDDALALLASALHYTPIGPWLDTAFAVQAAYPRNAADPTAPISLGIPTWLYGHEAPTPFATHIAKYFANSVREDGLLTIARHGIVFAPGGAGTVQEIFQDATQNHYQTQGFPSPMIFLDRHFWQHEKPVYPLLQQLASGRPYGALIAITDRVDEVVEKIERFAASR